MQDDKSFLPQRMKNINEKLKQAIFRIYTSPIELLDASLWTDVRAVDAILGVFVPQASNNGRNMSLLSDNTGKKR